MANYRFTLEPYKGMNTRYECPHCHKSHEFTRYIDTFTGNQVGPNVGICNRRDQCGYHYTPRQYFEDNKYLVSYVPANLLPVIAEKHKSYFSVIPEKTYQESLHAYSENNFVKFLLGLYGIPITNKLIKQYHIGTSKHWHGASIFWEVDIAGHIRSGKIMLYNAETGKRVKEPYDYLTWVHSVLELHEFKLQQCLFGEHLLNQNMEKPVAIFESEKTAIIASVHFPEYICLSCGGSNNINLDKCKVLKGRRVTFFPDLSPPSAKQSCYQKWKLLSTDLAKAVPDAEFVVSDLLENNSTDSEKQQGLDIADYLGRFSFVELQERNISKP